MKFCCWCKFEIAVHWCSSQQNSFIYSYYKINRWTVNYFTRHTSHSNVDDPPTVCTFICNIFKPILASKATFYAHFRVTTAQFVINRPAADGLYCQIKRSRAQKRRYFRISLLILHAQLYPDSDILLICFVLPYGYFWNVFLHICFNLFRPMVTFLKLIYTFSNILL